MVRTSRILTYVSLAVGVFLTFSVTGCGRKTVSPTVKIGVLLPLTGPSANQGQDALNGLNMKLDEIKTRQGLGIKLVVEDDQSDPKTGLSAFQKLASVDRVPAVIGPISSPVVLAISSQAERSNIVIVAIGASSPTISQAGDYIFRHCLLAERQAIEIARYCSEKLGSPKVGFLYINDETGMGYVNAFRREYKRLGGRIVAEETFDRGARDYRTQLIKLKAAGAEVLFSPGIPTSTGYILRQSADIGYRCKVLAGYGVEGQDVITIAGSEAERLIYTSFPYDASFTRLYQKRYGKQPSASAGLAYDALGMVADCLAKGERNGTQIRDYLYSVNNYTGVTGKISFDRNGDTQKEPIVFYTVKAGKFTALSK